MTVELDQLSENRWITRRQALLLFAAGALPIHLWSILSILRNLPAWVRMMTISEMVGVIAYTQLFALIESVGWCLLLILLATLLPAGWLRRHFVAQGSLWLLLTSLLGVAVFYSGGIIDLLRDAPRLWLFLGVYAASMAAVVVLVRRWPRLAGVVINLAQRSQVLVALYLVIDVLGLLLVIIRNI